MSYDNSNGLKSGSRVSSNFDIKMLDEKVTNFKFKVNLDEHDPISERVAKSIQKTKENRFSTRGNLTIIPSRDRHARYKNDHIKNNKNFWSSGYERSSISKPPCMDN